MAIKLMRAAVAVVVSLALSLTMSDGAAYSSATTIIRYMMTPNTAASTQQTWQVESHVYIYVIFSSTHIIQRKCPSYKNKGKLSNTIKHFFHHSTMVSSLTWVYDSVDFNWVQRMIFLSLTLIVANHSRDWMVNSARILLYFSRLHCQIGSFNNAKFAIRFWLIIWLTLKNYIYIVKKTCPPNTHILYHMKSYPSI